MSQLFDIEGKFFYKIPKYQREYTWTKHQWEDLYDDILENNEGYYLGSIICINRGTDTLKLQELELVDGQQRLMSISLLYAAIYTILNTYKEDIDEEHVLYEELVAELSNIRKKLIVKGQESTLRLLAQTQGFNSIDYEAVLSTSKMSDSEPAPTYFTSRRLYKAYSYFLDRLQPKEPSVNTDPICAAQQILEKLNQCCLVKIEVSSHADAYTLFESLNNRGIPLNIIDLIKNKLLSTLESDGSEMVDAYFKKWNTLLKYIGNEYKTQERFFRHYYNAFRPRLKLIHQVPNATRSNLINIYEELIDKDVHKNFDDIVNGGQIYSHILKKADGFNGQFSKLIKPLEYLDRIQGTPSHSLLLFLMSNKDDLSLSNCDIAFLIEVLVRFFVRRNITDFPPTRELDRMFIRIIESIPDSNNYSITSFIKSELRKESASDELFLAKLKGPIYDENRDATRFVLCTLAEKRMTDETKQNLWQRKNNNYVWTIEHIFPQGELIPKSWVEMIANGNADRAKEHQRSHVHLLGNLTITAYNSTLGTKSFLEKRDRRDNEGVCIGYNNGLSLNIDLAREESWDINKIQGRTDKLARQAMDRFALNIDS